MKRQEKLNLVLSLIALVVSIGTATYDRIATHIGENKKKTHKLYTAYVFGQRVIQGYIWASQINPKDEAERETVKRESLFQLASAQGLADALDLRMNVKEVFESTDPAKPDNPFNNRIFSVGQERLQAVEGHHAVAAYDLGAWLLWAFFESKIVAGDSTKEKALIELYPKFREHINGDLQELGIGDTMPNSISSLKDIEVATNRIKLVVEQRWEY